VDPINLAYLLLVETTGTSWPAGIL